MGFFDEVDAASGARGDWRRDPDGDHAAAQLAQCLNLRQRGRPPLPACLVEISRKDHLHQSNGPRRHWKCSDLEIHRSRSRGLASSACLGKESYQLGEGHGSFPLHQSRPLHEQKRLQTTSENPSWHLSVRTDLFLRQKSLFGTRYLTQDWAMSLRGLIPRYFIFIHNKLDPFKASSYFLSQMNWR